jgi:hypothetical protein
MIFEVSDKYFNMRFDPESSPAPADHADPKLAIVFYEFSGSLPCDLASLFNLKALTEPPIFDQIYKMLHDPHFLIVYSLYKVFFRHEDHGVQNFAIGDRGKGP